MSIINKLESNPNEKVLDRVKKMLALGNCSGATDGERDTALKMSFKLLALHNLTMVDVEGHNAEVHEPREAQQATYVVYPWARRMSNQIANLFFCNYYYIPPQWQAHGPECVLLHFLQAAHECAG